MKGRKIIFAVLLVIFLVVGGYIILLSQGLVVDLKHLRVVKTGAIFLSFDPSDALLEIDNKIPKTLKSLLNSGVLIKDVLPGDYEIKISKDGFYDWEKMAKVEAGLVTEFEKINLVPTKLQTEIVSAAGVENFWLTSEGIIYQKNRQLYFDKTALKGAAVILSSPDSPLVVTQSADNTYFLTDLGELKSITNLGQLFNSLKQQQLNLLGITSIKKIYLHPFGGSKLLIQTEGGIYSLDIKKVALELLLPVKNLSVWPPNNNEIFLTDASGTISAYNLIFKTKTDKETSLGPIENLKTDQTGDKMGLLTKNNGLVLLNVPKNEVINISSSSIEDFYFSADNKYLLTLRPDNQIEIFDLIEKESRSLNFPSLPIKGMTLPANAPNNFLVFSGNRLFIGDLTSGEPTNWHVISENVKKFELNKKELYILYENGELKRTVLFP